MMFTKEDAIKMYECLDAMRSSLAVAEEALAQYNRAKAEYDAIRERHSQDEDKVDDLVGAVYAGIVGARNHVPVS